MNLSPRPSPEPNYSEQHLADKNHGWDKNGFTDGGNWSMTQAYLTRGGGPIAETDMPYDPVHALGRQTSFPAKKWIREVQRRDNSVWWIPGYKEFCQDHIYTQNHGGVAATLYLDQSIFLGSNYYYYGAPLAHNHTAVLVGWNDNYRKENFKEFNGHLPYQDGALIIKNSWGKEAVWPDGDDGYFYISMDSFEFDPKIAFTDVVDSIANQYVYQYDLLGSTVSKNFDTTGKPNECTYANVFTAENPSGTIDNLKAIGFYLPWDEYGTCDYNYAITVYTDLTDGNNPKSGTEIATYKGIGWGTENGWYKYGGYRTQDIDPNHPIALNGGSKFSVIIQNTRRPPSVSPYSVCGYFLEKGLTPGTLNASSKWGESFQLTPTGWQDLKTLYRGPAPEYQELHYNACIKAFTTGEGFPKFNDKPDFYWKLKEALDDTTLNVTSDNGYNLNWKRVIDAEQTDAAKSSWINTGERCHMEATIDGPASIGFLWTVSSDPGNSLKFFIDGVEKKSIFGNSGYIPINWKQELFSLSTGSHKLEWSYEKTVLATAEYADCGWVDSFTKNAMLAVVTPNGGEAWLGGTNQLITWESAYIYGNLRIQLLKDDMLVGLIAEVPASDKMYIWEVGRWQDGLVPPGPGYKIRILTVGDIILPAVLKPIKK